MSAGLPFADVCMGGVCFVAIPTASSDAELVETPRRECSHGVKNFEIFMTNPQRGSFADLSDNRNFHRSRTGTRCGSFETMVTRVHNGYNRDSFRTEPQRDSFHTMVTRFQGRDSFITEPQRASFQTLPNRDSFEVEPIFQTNSLQTGTHLPAGLRHNANWQLTEKALQTHDNEVIAKRFAELRLGS